jgi:hypothetical protein
MIKGQKDSQIYIRKFVSDLWQVWRLSPTAPVSTTNKTYRHNTTEILVCVALNTQLILQYK